MPANFDSELRLALYREFVQTGRAPSSVRLSEIMATTVDEIHASLERLAIAKTIVLQPESREIQIAAPLSAIPTPFLVWFRGVPLFGACVWDALGIIGMLHEDAAVETSCACCGEAMSIAISGGRATTSKGIVHFAIPAKQWWDNIAFT